MINEICINIMYKYYQVLSIINVKIKIPFTKRINITDYSKKYSL